MLLLLSLVITSLLAGRQDIYGDRRRDVRHSQEPVKTLESEQRAEQAFMKFRQAIDNKVAEHFKWTQGKAGTIVDWDGNHVNGGGISFEDWKEEKMGPSPFKAHLIHGDVLPLWFDAWDQVLTVWDGRALVEDHRYDNPWTADDVRVEIEHQVDLALAELLNDEEITRDAGRLDRMLGNRHPRLRTAATLLKLLGRTELSSWKKELQRQTNLVHSRSREDLRQLTRASKAFLDGSRDSRTLSTHAKIILLLGGLSP